MDWLAGEGLRPLESQLRDLAQARLTEIATTLSRAPSAASARTFRRGLPSIAMSQDTSTLEKCRSTSLATSNSTAHAGTTSG